MTSAHTGQETHLQRLHAFATNTAKIPLISLFFWLVLIKHHIYIYHTTFQFYSENRNNQPHPSNITECENLVRFFLFKNNCDGCKGIIRDRMQFSYLVTLDNGRKPIVLCLHAQAYLCLRCKNIKKY